MLSTHGHKPKTLLHEQAKPFKWPAGALLVRTPDNLMTPEELIELDAPSQRGGPSGKEQRTCGASRSKLAVPTNSSHVLRVLNGNGALRWSR